MDVVLALLGTATGRSYRIVVFSGSGSDDYLPMFAIGPNMSTRLHSETCSAFELLEPMLPMTEARSSKLLASCYLGVARTELLPRHEWVLYPPLECVVARGFEDSRLQMMCVWLIWDAEHK